MSKVTFEVDMAIVSTVMDKVEIRTSPLVEVGQSYTFCDEIPVQQKGSDLLRFSYRNDATQEIVTFTQYDLRGFTFNGESLTKYFKGKAEGNPQIAPAFTIKGSEPVGKDWKPFTGTLRGGKDSAAKPQLAYPLPAYKGWSVYKAKKDELEEGQRMTREDRDLCKAEGVHKDSLGGHFRFLDIDHPLLYYREK